MRCPMRTFLTLVLLAAAPGFAAAQASKDDLIKLARAGISEDVIIAYLKSNGFDGRLTTDDLVELKGFGLGDRVLAILLGQAVEPPAADSTTPPAEQPSSAPWPYGTGQPS